MADPPAPLGIVPRGIPPTDPKYRDLAKLGRLPREYLNVHSFGAVANENINNSPAFQRAIDEAERVGAAGIFAPRGTYGIGAEVKTTASGIVLLGEGRDLTKLKWTGGTTGKMLSLGQGAGAGGSEVFHNAVRHLTLEGLSTGPDYAVYLEDYCIQWDISDVRINGFTKSAATGIWYGDHNYTGLVQRCFIHGNDHGIWCKRRSQFAIIRDCAVYGNVYNIRLGDSSGESNAIRQVSILNCDIELGTSANLYIANARGVNVRDCYFETKNAVEPITIAGDGENLLVHGCSFFKGTVGNTPCIEVNASVVWDFLTVRDCWIADSASSNIEYKQDSSASVKNRVFINNKFPNTLELSPISCELRATGQTFTHDTAAAYSFGAGSETKDNDDMHSTSVNPTRITIKTPGLYYLAGQISWAADTDTAQRSASIAVNGSDVYNSAAMSSADNRAIVNNPNGPKWLSTGDYVELMGRQRSGGDLTGDGVLTVTKMGE